MISVGIYRGFCRSFSAVFLLIVCTFCLSCEERGTQPKRTYDGVAELIPDLPRDDRAVWNPKGGTIAYEHFNSFADPDPSGIYLINEDGTGERLLIPWGMSPDWHPSGEKLAFARGGDIGIYDLHTDSIRMITVGRQRYYPSFSSDGKYLAFTHTRDVGDTHQRGAIVIYDLEADTSYVLPNRPPGDIGTWRHCDWRPATYELIFERGLYDLWSADYLGNNLKFVAYAEYPRWSYDGVYLCFSTSTNRRDSTWILNIFSSFKEHIGFRLDASFSNDGRRIVYTVLIGDYMDPYNGKWILRIYDRDTREEIDLTH